MDLILKYFPHLDEKMREQLDQLQSLYTHWNQQINVISRKDIENLYLKHVLHSLSIARWIQFPDKASVLDVGTGGGFPGIPLAICFPKVQFYLIDSIGKKIKVCEEISKALQLKNVICKQTRAENWSQKHHYVVSRAVAQSDTIINWLKKNIKQGPRYPQKNGFIFLKGGDLEEELKAIKRKYTLTPLSDFFEESFYETKYLVHIPVVE